MKNIQYVGCDDAALDLFESQYALPEGMCYNSYVVLGEKQVAVMDAVDARCAHAWLNKVSEALDGRMPDYLVCHHMEPDHSGAMALFLAKYPQAQVVCSKSGPRRIDFAFYRCADDPLARSDDELLPGRAGVV